MWILIYCQIWSAVAQVVEALPDALERGDADSSGSTLRTMGIVILVLAVVSIIAPVIVRVANSAVVQLGSR